MNENKGKRGSNYISGTKLSVLIVNASLCVWSRGNRIFSICIIKDCSKYCDELERIVDTPTIYKPQ